MRLGVAMLLALAAGCSRPPDAAPRATAAPTAVKPTLTVRMTGHDYQWLIRYPGADGVLDTDDDVATRQHLHLPADTSVRLDLGSDDYVYTLFLPHLDWIEAAVPDVPLVLEFDSGAPAKHELRGSQMCGFTHPGLIGELVVQEPQTFAAWLAAQ